MVGAATTSPVRVGGKIAVVTGAAHGLGRAVALRLASQGADLVLGDIDRGKLDDTAHEIAGIGRAAGVVAGFTLLSNHTGEVLTYHLSESLDQLNTARIPQTSSTLLRGAWRNTEMLAEPT